MYREHHRLRYGLGGRDEFHCNHLQGEGGRVQGDNESRIIVSVVFDEWEETRKKREWIIFKARGFCCALGLSAPILQDMVSSCLPL